MRNGDTDDVQATERGLFAQDEDALYLAALTIDEATSADLRWRLESAPEGLERQEMALYSAVRRETVSRGVR